jgi:hypothetical protein
MAAKKSATAANIKNLDLPEAVQHAGDIKSLTAFIDLSNQKIEEDRKSLLGIISSDCSTSIIEDGIAFGCYHIPVLDEMGGNSGEVVEVVLSVDASAINAEEQSVLQGILVPADFDKLFELCHDPVSITSPEELATYLGAHSSPSSLFELKKGKITLTLDYGQKIPGLTIDKAYYSRNGFFIKLQEVVNQVKNNNLAVKTLVEWLEKHVKMTVRTGNRGKATTTP